MSKKDSDYKYLVYARDSEGHVVITGSIPGKKKLAFFLDNIDEDAEIFHISDDEVIVRKPKESV